MLYRKKYRQFDIVANPSAISDTIGRRRIRYNIELPTSYDIAFAHHVAGFDYNYYLRQVNEVNGGDNVFVRCVSVCLCVCECAADR